MENMTTVMQDYSTAGYTVQYVFNEGWNGSFNQLKANLVGSLLIIAAIVATLGNSLIVATVLDGRELREDTNNLLIVNLAVADAAYACFGVLPSATWSIDILWQHGYTPCKLKLWAEMALNQNSNFALMIIAICRFLYIAYPLHYGFWMTYRMIFGMCMLAWVFALTSIALTLFAEVGVTYFNGDVCFFLFSDAMSHWFNFVTYIIPFTIIFFFGLRVLLIAISHQRRIATLTEGQREKGKGTNRSSWKSVKSFLIVVSVFLLLQGPECISLAVTTFCNCIPHVFWYSHFIYPILISCSVNPFIYFFFAQRFRKGLLQMFRCDAKEPRNQCVSSGSTQHTQQTPAE